MTPVGVFFICQNEDKCHFVNSTYMSHIRLFCIIPLFGAVDKVSQQPSRYVIMRKTT